MVIGEWGEESEEKGLGRRECGVRSGEWGEWRRVVKKEKRR